MKKQLLKNMHKGWLIGDFEPTILRTQNVEVGIKEYSKGMYEEKHYHKIATEITIITTGKVRMNGNIFQKGDIIIIEPNEATDFEVLEDTITTVIKIPGAKNDKYMGESSC